MAGIVDHTAVVEHRKQIAGLRRFPPEPYAWKGQVHIAGGVGKLEGQVQLAIRGVSGRWIGVRGQRSDAITWTTRGPSGEIRGTRQFRKSALHGAGRPTTRGSRRRD